MPLLHETFIVFVSMDSQENISAIRAWLGTGAINIFGAPFAGKDTQGQRLAELLDAPLVGGGDILRNSVIPEHVKKIMHDGKLIPTEDYLRIVLPYLSQQQFEGRPLVLSSVGRWQGEEAGVVEALKQADHQLRAVVFLNLEERYVWRRWEESQGHNLRGKRHDDAADVLEVRLEEFNVKTLSVINFYRSLGLLVEIDGNQTPEEITQAMVEALAKR